MGKLLQILLSLFSIYLAYVFYGIFSDGQAPALPDFYWGPKGTEIKEDRVLRPFKINITEKVLTDLKTRLKLEVSAEGDRLTPPLEGIGFEYGFNTNFLKTVTNHWLNKYDWRAREKALNKYPHFRTSISGIDIHFQHARSLEKKQYKHTRPLLLLHGWPGSFVEFQRVIPHLIDPVNSDMNFQVIIPSLPGYGFTEAAHRPGLGPVETAQLFHKLMKSLGHLNYYVHGGDWGSLIATHMATLYPESVVALHTNMCVCMHPRVHLRQVISSIWPTLFVHEDDLKHLSSPSELFPMLIEETGYLHLHATKPDTVGVALSNSPSGLAAYILEKFSTWTNKEWKNKANGGLVPYYQLDDLLDNLMIYWVTNSITTSTRFYAEALSKRTRGWGLDSVPVNVPTGFLALSNDLFLLPEWHLRDKYPQIISYTRGDTGGHFAAFELPDIVAADILKFFTLVDQTHSERFNIFKKHPKN